MRRIIIAPIMLILLAGCGSTSPQKASGTSQDKKPSDGSTAKPAPKQGS